MSTDQRRGRPAVNRHPPPHVYYERIVLPGRSRSCLTRFANAQRWASSPRPARGRAGHRPPSGAVSTDSGTEYRGRLSYPFETLCSRLTGDVMAPPVRGSPADHPVAGAERDARIRAQLRPGRRVVPAHVPLVGVQRHVEHQPAGWSSPRHVDGGHAGAGPGGAGGGGRRNRPGGGGNRTRAPARCQGEAHRQARSTGSEASHAAPRPEGGGVRCRSVVLAAEHPIALQQIPNFSRSAATLVRGPTSGCSKA
jgi:hypothetical protein